MINSIVRGVCLSALVSIFVGCDSNSSGGGGGDIPAAQEPTLGSAMTIEGTAAKGIVSLGVVDVFPIVNGVKSQESIAQAITSVRGTYSVTLPESAFDVPYVLEVSADENTTIKCDLAEGCGNGIDFGGSTTVNSDFKLSAIIPDVNVQSEANLTVFSHAAAQNVVENLVLGESNTDLREAVANANSAVSARFGFTGDVSRIPVIDITDADSVSAATEEVLRFSVFNSAAISATRSNNTDSQGQSTLTISQAISSFTTQYVGGGFADKETENTSSVSIVEILTKASTVVTVVSGLDGVNSTVISSVTTSIENTTTFISINGSTDPSPGMPSPAAGGTDVAQAKAFVQDLRVLSQESFLSDEEEVAFDSLESKVNILEDIDADNVEDALKALIDAVEVAIETYNELDGEPTAQDMPYSATIDGLVFTATAVDAQDDALVITVVQPQTDLNLVATLNTFDDTEDETRSGDDRLNIYDFLLDASLTGSATVGNSTATFSDVLVNIDTDVREERSSTREDFEQNVDITLSGILSLTQVNSAGEQYLTLMGNANLTLEDVNYVEGSDSVDFNRSSNEVATLDYQSLSLSLVGEISDAMGTKVDGSFVLSSGPHSAEQVCTLEDECSDIEAGGNIIPVSLALNFNAYVDGGSIADVTATLTRIEDEEASVEVTLAYDSKTITIMSQTDREGATITNQDNIVATIDEQDGGDMLMQGTIKKGETTLADITTTSNDILLIRYTDGTIESL